MTIFKKLRRNTIGKNVGNYLAYAIGEIILIVAGILIAVTLNNWNSKRNISQENSRTINDLQLALNNKQHYYYPYYKAYEKYENYLASYIYDTIRKNSQRKKYLKYYLLNDHDVSTLDSELFSEILANKSNFQSDKYGNLLDGLEFLQKCYVRIYKESKEREEMNKKIIDVISNQGKIHLSYDKLSEIDEYIKENPAILNQMRLQYLSISRSKDLIEYSNTINICLQIQSDNVENGTNLKKMDSIFKFYGFTKLKPLESKTQQEKLETKQCMTAIYNNTDKRLRVYSDENRIETGIFIQPYAFSYVLNPKGKLLYVYNDNLTELVGEYKVKYDSYFIIE